VVDLLLVPARRELLADERLHLLGERRVRLVERLVARGADAAGLDLCLARVLAAVRAEGEREAEDERDDRQDCGERLHCFSAVRIPSSSSSGVAAPTMCPTCPVLFGGSGMTRPCRSMKN